MKHLRKTFNKSFPFIFVSLTYTLGTSFNHYVVRHNCDDRCQHEPINHKHLLESKTLAVSKQKENNAKSYYTGDISDEFEPNSVIVEFQSTQSIVSSFL